MPPVKHAWTGPSSIARVLACPPSARFSEQFPDTESEYAALGTETHELCEYLVRKALGEKVRSPKNKLKLYSEEMQECAEGYAAYVMEMYETAKQSCRYFSTVYVLIFKEHCSMKFKIYFHFIIN